MPGHGNHWETLYPLDEAFQDRIARWCQEGIFVGDADCMDVLHGSNRPEAVRCLRWGGDRLTNQVLVVTDSSEPSQFLYSAYPVALDGAPLPVTVRRITPWTHGLEGWVEADVIGAGMPIHFFDNLFYAGAAHLQPGQQAEFVLAGLAYVLKPIEQQFIEVGEGALWEMERDQRLANGASPEEAAQPVRIHMAGAAIFWQLGNSEESPDDAQFQGTIEAIDSFEHDSQRAYRLELLLGRTDGEFRLPVFAAAKVLQGYVPRLGEDVQGVLWLQGYRVGAQESLR